MNVSTNRLNRLWHPSYLYSFVFSKKPDTVFINYKTIGTAQSHLLLFIVIGKRLHKLGNGILLEEKMKLALTKVKSWLDCITRNQNWDLWINKLMNKWMYCICSFFGGTSRCFGRNFCLETRLTQNLNFYPTLVWTSEARKWNMKIKQEKETRK